MGPNRGDPLVDRGPSRLRVAGVRVQDPEVEVPGDTEGPFLTQAHDHLLRERAVPYGVPEVPDRVHTPSPDLPKDRLERVEIPVGVSDERDLHPRTPGRGVLRRATRAVRVGSGLAGAARSSSQGGALGRRMTGARPANSGAGSSPYPFQVPRCSAIHR